MHRIPFRSTGLAALLALLAGCGGGTTSVRITAHDEAALHPALTALPAGAFEQICLNVIELRLRVDADDDAQDGWHAVPVHPAGPDDETADCPLDLAALLRGDAIELAVGEVPSGELTEIRFVLDSSDQGWATTVDAPETSIPVFVPSGSQSGLKLKGARIALEPDEEQDIALVFDAEASLREHQGGALRIRPVVRVRGYETVPVGEDAGSEAPIAQ